MTRAKPRPPTPQHQLDAMRFITPLPSRGGKSFWTAAIASHEALQHRMATPEVLAPKEHDKSLVDMLCMLD